MKSKRILLIIGGGIAAFKCLDLIRRLKEHGASVRVLLTKSGAEFVTPLSVTVLSGEAVHQDLFDPLGEAEIGHIELSRQADLIVVAPATANIMARMANGIADDLASTVLLATDKPVLIAPAMNVRMWEHAATKRNKKRLRKDGIKMVGPNEGDMACGEFGEGRMAEVPEIIEAIQQSLGEVSDDNLTSEPAIELTNPQTGPLRGRSVLVTAGPTREPIDPVRYISNHSSGKQGYAIARKARDLGAKVTLVTGPTALDRPDNIKVIEVETAREMDRACRKALPVDIAICTAAVADWRVKGRAGSKIKKARGKPVPTFELTENPDILKAISNHKSKRPGLVIGFAAETNAVLEHAKAKLKRKGCDWIVANDVSEEGGVMGAETNTIHLLSGDKVDSWPELSKTEVAERLLRRAAAALSGLTRATG